LAASDGSSVEQQEVFTGARIGPSVAIVYYDIADVEIHRSARKHGIPDAAILHALDQGVAVVGLSPTPTLERSSLSGPTMPAISLRSFGLSSPMGSIS
jgi:hypothetical protein